MGVVTISSSAARSPLGLSRKISSIQRSASRRPLIVAFKSDKSEARALVVPRQQTPLPIEISKEQHKKRGRKAKKALKSVKSLSTDERPLSSSELDYNEAAAKLESIFKLSPSTKISDLEDLDGILKKRRKKRKSGGDSNGEVDNSCNRTVVRSRTKRIKRLSLDGRVALKKNKEGNGVSSFLRKNDSLTEDEKIDRLVRNYSASTNLVSLDWKKMKIPPVLPANEHVWLFKLLQPWKALRKSKEDLQKVLGRDPAGWELAQAVNMTASEVRKHLEVGRAARNKLIKHNLRLVLFVMNKYFHDFASGPKFQDLCQAGVKGLMIAIDRFETSRKFRLSTYSLFWIRHAIIRYMTVSNFTRIPFGLESVRVEIQKAKSELFFELQRQPTDEEIIEKVGISPERYQDVLKAAQPVGSLHSRHAVTQEELINGITDVVGGDNRKQPALLRLALDDVLDSLKPKESLVIRQRYGLDGRGERTLGEIAGNLNISREMVRKHEVRALLKLKHPARADYLRRHVV